MTEQTSPQSIDESHYEGLMSSMRHARNRLLFFILFLAYSFLAILGTSDKMLFMETPINMPLLNIELPLVAFYVVMPLFILVLYFHLLYTFRSYREFLLNTQQQHPAALASFPIGLYEGALLKQDSFHIAVRVAMRFLLYIFPVFVLTAFWFRFADYQSLVVSSWHFIIILKAVFFGFYFRSLLTVVEPQRIHFFTSLRQIKLSNIRGKRIRLFFSSLQAIKSVGDVCEALCLRINQLGKSLKKGMSFLILSAMCLLFIGLIGSYQLAIIYPLSKTKVDLNKLKLLKIYEEEVDEKLRDILKRTEWFLPRIILRGEVLVPIDKELLEVLQEANQHEKNNKALIFSVPVQNKKRRNFRLTVLDKCILPNTNFQKAQLQGAFMQEAQLQEAYLRGAFLQDAYLMGADLQGADLAEAQLQGVSLNGAKLQGAYIANSQLQGANLSYADLKGADLGGAKLQGADLSRTQLQASTLSGAQLQGARLNEAQLQGAFLVLAQLKGSSLKKAQLQGANLSNAQLQGANLSNAQLQGANLSNAQLQGAQSKNNIIFFINAKQMKTDLTNLNSSILIQESVDKMIVSLQSYIRLRKLRYIDDENIEIIKQRLQNAIGKDSIQWVKNQKGINLGILSEEEFNKIAESITVPEARERMILPPLKTTKIPSH